MKEGKKERKLDKKIKRAETFENLFRALGSNINAIKSFVAAIVTFVMFCLGNKVNYYVCVGVCGALWSDFLAEAVTNYGENLCDKICIKFYDKVVALKGIKKKEQEKISAVNNDEVVNAQIELGILPKNKNVLVLNQTRGNSNSSVDEKIC